MDRPYRLWSRPLLASDNVVVITADALLLLSVPLEQLPGVEARLRRGEQPADATVIRLDQVHEAYAGGSDAKLTVFHGPDAVGYRAEVFFDGPTPRDQVLAELHARLGPGWELDDRDRMQAGTLLLLLVILAVTTIAGYFGVRQVEGGTAPAPVNARGELGQGWLEMLSASVGSLGVLAVGLVACGLCLWGAIHARRHPPKGPGVRLKRVGVASRY